MGVHVIKMPDIGEGIAEVELVMWYVKVGDAVTEDMILADVMTEKATIEIPSPVHGKVLSLGGVAGQPRGGHLLQPLEDLARPQRVTERTGVIAIDPAEPRRGEGRHFHHRISGARQVGTETSDINTAGT